MPRQTVVVQLGQCGNQVGPQFFQLMHDELQCISEDDRRVFESVHFDQQHHRGQRRAVARSVLIDMEPKAVRQFVRWPSGCMDAMQQRNARSDVSTGGTTSASALSSPAWSYDATEDELMSAEQSPAVVIGGQGGSGNNWALGFMTNGPAARDAVLDAVRHQVEKCDVLGGFLGLSSLAGGTGSGLGAYVWRELRDEYADAALVSHVVWPHEGGDVIVQHYNSLLTLAELNKSSDAIVIHENDMLHEVCKSLLSIRRPSFSDMNLLMAKAIAATMLPSYDAVHLGDAPTLPPSMHIPSDWLDFTVDPMTRLTADLCPHPAMKLLTTYMVPQVGSQAKSFTSHTWSGIVGQLVQRIATGKSLDGAMGWSSVTVSEHGKVVRGLEAALRSSAWWITLRGSDLAVRDHCRPDSHWKRACALSACGPLCASHESAPLFSSVAPFGCQLSVAPLNFDSLSGMGCAVGNSQYCLRALDRMVSRATETMQSGAYMHHYTSRGIDKDYLCNALLEIEQVAQCYRQM